MTSCLGLRPPRTATAARAGFSLLEVAVVVTVLGILAAVGMSRLGQTTYGNLGAQGDARRIALDLLQAQRRAISTGDNHYLQFTPGGGPVTSYALVRRAAGGDVTLDTVSEIPRGVTITPSHAVAEFNFEGAALAAYQIEIAGPDRNWTVSAVPATGAVRVLENP